jgi:hypothetical protein
MQQSRFDALREQLLRAGIAPRHVRRYVGELRDHFDDLMREEIAGGASQSAAEIRARTRLGSDSDLAEVMLARPDLRSLSARHPLAVFAAGPLAMVLAALAVGLAVEIGIFQLVPMLAPHPSAAQRDMFVFAIGIWNSLATIVAPLAIAIGLCLVGLRQRMSSTWIFVAIACACVLGAFQEIHFSDDGHHGALSLGSGLMPPFPASLIIHGFYRFAITAALAGTVYWFGTRRQRPGAAQIDQGVMHAAE